jgi:hypothetical protein
MDPNLTLSRIRSILRTVSREQDGIDEPFTEAQARNILEQLTEHVAALDEWLSGAGFLPTAWEPTAGLAYDQVLGKPQTDR